MHPLDRIVCTSLRGTMEPSLWSCLGCFKRRANHSRGAADREIDAHIWTGGERVFSFSLLLLYLRRRNERITNRSCRVFAWNFSRPLLRVFTIGYVCTRACNVCQVVRILFPLIYFALVQCTPFNTILYLTVTWIFYFLFFCILRFRINIPN